MGFGLGISLLLGMFVVSGNGIPMDLAKVKAIVSWPGPTNVHEVLSFLELV